MAASQIAGYHWTDDTGTWQNPQGNGTPINDAALQQILTRINSVFAMATPTFSGLLRLEGYGSHTFAAAGPGMQEVRVRNTNAGTGAHAQFVAQSNGAGLVALQMVSETYVDSVLGLLPDGARLLATGAGGLALTSTHSSGTIRFLPNGLGTPLVTFSSAGIASAMGGIRVAGNVLVEHANSPQIVLRDSDAPLNQKAWTMATHGPFLRFQSLNDDHVGTSVMLELERSSVQPLAVRAHVPLEVTSYYNMFNAQVRAGFAADSLAPAVLQSGEPGNSATLVILANNYYGVNGGASGRINPNIGGSFIRLGQGALEFCRVVHPGGTVVGNWTMDGNGHFLPSVNNVYTIGNAASRVNALHVSTAHASRYQLVATTGGTHYMEMDGSGETLYLTVDGSTNWWFGSDIQPGFSVRAATNTVIMADRTGNDGHMISLRRDNTEQGSITVNNGTVSYNTFVGSHYTQLQDAEVAPPPGTLVVSTGTLISTGGQDKFPYVELSSSRGQKGVYGAWFAQLTDDPSAHAWARQDRPIYQVAALGLWFLRVTDTGGDIQNGDLLQASPRPGLAERQVEADGTTYVPFLLDATVARARVGVNWSTVSPNARGIKEALIAVTLHAG